MLVEIGSDQGLNFACLGMAFGLKFAIEQLPINFNFKTATLRGNEAQLLNRLAMNVQQLGCQTDSTRGVVSIHTKGNGDLHQQPPKFNKPLVQLYSEQRT